MSLSTESIAGSRWFQLFKAFHPQKTWTMGGSFMAEPCVVDLIKLTIR